MVNDKTKDRQDKILKGLDLNFRKLLQSKQKENGEFIFLQNEEIVRIKGLEMNRF